MGGLEVAFLTVNRDKILVSFIIFIIILTITCVCFRKREVIKLETQFKPPFLVFPTTSFSFNNPLNRIEVTYNASFSTENGCFKHDKLNP